MMRMKTDSFGLDQRAVPAEHDLEVALRARGSACNGVSATLVHAAVHHNSTPDILWLTHETAWALPAHCCPCHLLVHASCWSALILNRTPTQSALVQPSTLIRS